MFTKCLTAALHLGCHKVLNEAIINALEFEMAKKASQQIGSLYYVMALKKLKENESVIKALKDLLQKYSDRNSWKEDRPKCFNSGKSGYFKHNCKRLRTNYYKKGRSLVEIRENLFEKSLAGNQRKKVIQAASVVGNGRLQVVMLVFQKLIITKVQI